MLIPYDNLPPTLEAGGETKATNQTEDVETRKSEMEALSRSSKDGSSSEQQ